MLVVVAAVVGLVVGSFLNVVVWRVPREESVVRPPSRCPACSHDIRPRDNVPVFSWLALRGRCRDCGAFISARYPLVEALTAAVFGLLAWHLDSLWELPAFLYLAAVGIALAFIDLDVHRLPNALTLPSYPIAAALLAVGALGEHDPYRLARAAVGMAALYAFYYVLMLVKQGGMGFGDVKLAGVLGMYLGYLGWGVLAVGAFLGFLLGGLAGFVLLALRRVGRRDGIPFGPSMVAGALLAVFVGQRIADVYSSATLH